MGLSERTLPDEGLEERYQPVTEELRERLEYELSTIREHGVCGLFPDRLGLYQIRQRQRYHGGPGPGIGGGKPGGLHP